MLQYNLILSIDNIIASWAIKSRASFHATPHKNYFHYHIEGDFGQVYLGDGELCKIVGKGKVWIKL